MGFYHHKILISKHLKDPKNQLRNKGQINIKILIKNITKTFIQ